MSNHSSAVPKPWQITQCHWAAAKKDQLTTMAIPPWMCSISSDLLKDRGPPWQYDSVVLEIFHRPFFLLCICVCVCVSPHIYTCTSPKCFVTFGDGSYQSESLKLCSVKTLTCDKNADRVCFWQSVWMTIAWKYFLLKYLSLITYQLQWYILKELCNANTLSFIKETLLVIKLLLNY